MVRQAQEKDPWKIYLAKGAGDRAIAGDHEERHVLELLQNARDAIFRGRLEGNTLPGRVLIAVTDLEEIPTWEIEDDTSKERSDQAVDQLIKLHELLRKRYPYGQPLRRV